MNSTRYWWLGALVCALLVGSELFCRVVLGLGTPPLSIPHPKIEYMFRPNQDLWRFHNHIIINESGMRSPSPRDPSYTRRIIVFGDSVINGGAQTDHADLATTLVSNMLSKDGQKVFVGNVSAGSWGPPNILAWIDEFGFQEADTAVFVFSSHDLCDQPTFEPLNPLSHPTKPPTLALVEGIERYLWPRIASVLPSLKPPQQNSGPQPTEVSCPDPRLTEAVRPVLPQIIARVKSKNLRACVVEHLTDREVKAGPDPEHFELAKIFGDLGVPIVQLSDFLPHAPVTDAELAKYYRDDIHINAEGQKALSKALLKCIDIAR